MFICTENHNESDNRIQFNFFVYVAMQRGGSLHDDVVEEFVNNMSIIIRFRKRIFTQIHALKYIFTNTHLNHILNNGLPYKPIPPDELFIQIRFTNAAL